ncbi:MAG: dihydroneopterin aldolase [Rhodospirillaceae bacterium]|nr:dihydroneopterin aldolase [Rhodospirillaceae bacterium]
MTQMGFYRLFVRDLVVPSSIGIHRHERDAPQRVRVTVEIDIAPLFSTESDSIGAVLSYDNVVAAVKKIISLGHINLVETLADRIATNCLEDARVVKVKVVVEKLDVLGGEATVGAEIVRVNDR